MKKNDKIETLKTYFTVLANTNMEEFEKEKEFFETTCNDVDEVIDWLIKNKRINPKNF